MNRDSSNFGDFLGFTYPRKTPNFGDASGTGKPQILGIFWGKSPKIFKFWGGGGGKNLGDFPTTTHQKP